MFNIHKKCEEKYNKLVDAYSECYNESAKLKEKISVMKQDNEELAAMVEHTQLHIQALCLINSALMEVVTKEQKEEAYKIIKHKENKIKPSKRGTLKKEVKRGRKKKSN